MTWRWRDGDTMKRIMFWEDFNSDPHDNLMKTLDKIHKDQAEKDPNGKDLKGGGAKADAGKIPLYQGLIDYFPRAVLEVAKVSQEGARKYSWKGWETVPNGPARYSDALARHLVAEAIEGPRDANTGMLHAAQVCWNSLARLELILREMEDRK